MLTPALRHLLPPMRPSLAHRPRRRQKPFAPVLWGLGWVLSLLGSQANVAAQSDACRFVWTPATWRLLPEYGLRLYATIEEQPVPGARALFNVGWGYRGYASFGNEVEWEDLTVTVFTPAEGKLVRKVTSADPDLAERGRFNVAIAGPELDALRQRLRSDPFPDVSRLSDEEKHRIISQAAFVSYFSGTSGYFQSDSISRLGSESAWAYDSRRRVLVVFNTDGETWEWNGEAFKKMSFSFNRPGTRSAATMVYDEAREVCVLFGGRVGDTLDANDLWEFDAQGWILRQGIDSDTTNQPPASVRPLMAYDPGRGKTVLVERDTWEWDGTNWLHLKVPGPFGRFLDAAAVALAYDPVRRVTVLFEGTQGETWTWDGATWRRVAMAGPPPRAEAAMAFDLRRKVMVLFGGRTARDEMLGDTWEWDGAVWSLVAEAGRLGLRPHRGSKMWYDAAEARLVLFGGYAPGLSFDDMWEARPPGSWVDFEAPPPPLVPETGFFYAPYNTIEEAVANAMPGCRLNLKAGSSSAALTITKPLTLDAFYGPVTLGQP